MPFSKHQNYNNEMPSSTITSTGEPHQYPPAEFLPPHGAPPNAQYDDRAPMGGRSGYAENTGYDGYQLGMTDTRHHNPGGFQQSSQYDDAYGPQRHGGAAIPPAGSHGTNHSEKPHGSVLGGKIQHAVGTLVSSQTMKAKGIQQEQDARAHKVQNSELQQAELLEREALASRERAVAHGAHPDNRHHGGASGMGGPGGMGGSGMGPAY